MSDSPEALRRKIDGASDLEAVVRTMKALAAASITQYEQAVQALENYNRTVQLGLSACFRQHPFNAADAPAHGQTAAILFGSDQGLVGQFNDSLTAFALSQLPTQHRSLRLWCVGERVADQLAAAGLPAAQVFNVPNSLQGIGALVTDLLTALEPHMAQLSSVQVFHNRPQGGTQYQATGQRLLPLDTAWKNQVQSLPWPSKHLAEVLHCGPDTLRAMLNEHLFISLFRACTESLASENASRLAAMQRAEKNINEMLDELRQEFHRLRQNNIDAELFDVVAGYDLLFKKEPRKTDGPA